MVAFVAVRAWPTLAHNGGVAWLGPGGSTDHQLGGMISTGRHAPAAAYHLRAWPLVYGTLLCAGLAGAIRLAFPLLFAIFIVQFPPPPPPALPVPPAPL